MKGKVKIYVSVCVLASMFTLYGVTYAADVSIKLGDVNDAFRVEYPSDVSLMDVLGSGTVGIGGAQTCPEGNYKLSVNGNIYIHNEVVVGPPVDAEDPSYTFCDDNNTGILSPIADTMTFLTGGSEAMRIDNNGNVGIGIDTPIHQLQLSRDSAGKPSTSTWTVVSDERVKTDIKDFTDGLDKICSIRPVTYRYNGKAGFKDTERINIGVIGQEIQKIVPYTVNTFKTKLNKEDEEETELLNFDSHALTFVLINSVKELKAENDALKHKVNTVKAENVQLKKNLLALVKRQDALESIVFARTTIENGKLAKLDDTD